MSSMRKPRASSEIESMQARVVRVKEEIKRESSPGRYPLEASTPPRRRLKGKSKVPKALLHALVSMNAKREHKNELKEEYKREHLTCPKSELKWECKAELKREFKAESKRERGSFPKSEYKLESKREQAKLEGPKTELKYEGDAVVGLKRSWCDTFEPGSTPKLKRVKHELKEEDRSHEKFDGTASSADQAVGSIDPARVSVKKELEWPWVDASRTSEFIAKIPYYEQMCLDFQASGRTWHPIQPCCGPNFWIKDRTRFDFLRGGAPIPCLQRLSRERVRDFRLTVERGETLPHVQTSGLRREWHRFMNPEEVKEVPDLEIVENPRKYAFPSMYYYTKDPAVEEYWEQWRRDLKKTEAWADPSGAAYMENGVYHRLPDKPEFDNIVDFRSGAKVYEGWGTREPEDADQAAMPKAQDEPPVMKQQGPFPIEPLAKKLDVELPSPKWQASEKRWRVGVYLSGAKKRKHIYVNVTKCMEKKMPFDCAKDMAYMELRKTVREMYDRGEIRVKHRSKERRSDVKGVCWHAEKALWQVVKRKKVDGKDKKFGWKTFRPRMDTPFEILKAKLRAEHYALDLMWEHA